MTLEEALRIRPDLSYWWMTVPTEHSFNEQTAAYKAIRLWALAELADTLGLSHLEVIGADHDIARVLREWGSETGRTVSTVAVPDAGTSLRSRITALRRSKSTVIQVISAVYFLGSQFAKYSNHRVRSTRVAAQDKADVTIVDYFTNFRIDDDLASKYDSNYWGPLPELLDSLGKSVHWIHINCPSRLTPDVPSARAAIAALNGNTAKQRHSLLQDQMSPSVAANAIRTYLRIVRSGLRVSKGRTKWTYNPASMNMWPILQRQWRRSVYGVLAAENSLWLSYFESASRERDLAGDCLYLMENQPWELALLSNWHTAGRHLAGVPHSTVRPWDLRYAMGHSVAQQFDRRGLPRPDMVFVNGPLASSMLIENGYPSSRLHEVEALRYLRKPVSPTRTSGFQGRQTGVLELLAMGEYDARMAGTQMEMLNELVRARGTSVNVTFRPHPATIPPLRELDPRIRMSESHSIGPDLAASHVVFCGSVSSAVLDAMLAGRRVITFPDGRVFDGSAIPIGQSFIAVTNGAELLDALNWSLEDAVGTNPRIHEIFFISNDLLKWSTAIAIVT
jgi:surface carbohydrate biosynthesis protein (TIGR04326 family)